MRSLQGWTNLGSILRLYRTANGMNLSTFSLQIGIGASTLGRIEKGRTPDARTLTRLLTWMMHRAIVLVAVLAVSSSSASAGPAKIRFTHPCKNPDGTQLTDLRSERVYIRRIPAGSETVYGELPAQGREGTLDSFVLGLPDTVHYALVQLAGVNSAGKEGGRSSTYLVAAPASPALQLLPGLQATYFDNNDLTSPWYASRVDSAINFDWDYAAPLPGMGVETFSIRWEGYIVAPIAGAYLFRAQVEDGARAWVGPMPVLDDWAIQEEHSRTFLAQLAQGPNAFRFEYFANNGDAAMKLYWTPPGALEAIVSANVLFHASQGQQP